MTVFANGTVVKLKSGGPTMTVVQQLKKMGDDYCRCTWFNNNTQEFGDFPASGLINDDVIQEDEENGFTGKLPIDLISIPRPPIV